VSRTERYRLSDHAVIAPGIEAQLREWRKRLEAGERRVGWKIGLNDPAVQRQLGISEPVIGYLTSGSQLPVGAAHSLGGGTRVGVEAEIAVQIDADLPAGADRAAAEAAIGALAPAIELVDIDLPFDDLGLILRKNVFHRAVMLGAESAPALEDLTDVSLRIARDGLEETAADVTDAAGALPEIVRHVADLLGRFGERLCAGDRIISGSLAAIVWVEPGDRVEVEIDPLGTLQMSFTG
jgi:2-keto-4-pentenoate hydratase